MRFSPSQALSFLVAGATMPLARLRSVGIVFVKRVPVETRLLCSVAITAPVLG